MTAPEPASPVPDRLRTRFREEFGAAPEALCFAPGRINLIGAHLDYSGGDVVPLAVDLGVYVAGRRRGDGRIRLRSLDQPLAVDVGAAEVGERTRREHGWAGYPLGVWQQIRTRNGVSEGCDLVFGADLPMASGMSSSAAIEVTTALLLDHLHELGLDPLELALLCHRAEVDYAGVECGIMDQFASALGRPGHALLLHCHAQSHEHVEMRGRGFEVLVMDTRKPRELASVGFNERVRECARAHAVLRRTVRELPFLAAFTPDEVEGARDDLGDVLYRRARHVTTEMGRVAQGVGGLRSGRIEELGAALTASHRSTSVDYDVSCAELDAITAAACESAHTFGARLTGAGFGGCAIALVEEGAGDAVRPLVSARFHAAFGVQPGFMVLHAGGGPRVVDSR